MQFWMIKMMHHWLGVVFGAFFFVICLSGVGVTLDQMRGGGNIQAVSEPLPVSQIMDDMAAFERRGLLPKGTQILIDLPSNTQSVYRFRTADAHVTLYADGEANVALPDRGSPASSFMWNVHANLLNLFGRGHGLVIWTGMVGAYVSLLGLIIFVPVRGGFRKNSVLHPQALSFREIRRAHFSSGIVFFVLVIFFGVTGWAAGAPQTASDILRPQTADLPYAPAPETAIGFDDVLKAALLGASVGERITQIRLTQDDRREAVYVYMKSDKSMARRVVVDRILGVVAGQETSAPKNFSAKMNAKMAGWHSGKGHGALYKLLLCITGLIAGLIALTGFVSYIWRWKIQIAGLLRRRKTKEMDG